jgi:hypothetical protein
MLGVLAIVLGLLVVFPAVGIVTRRWLVVVLPLVVWPLFYEGVHRGWYLFGTGDGWQEARASLTVMGVATTALAVFVARSLESRSRGDRMPVGES